MSNIVRKYGETIPNELRNRISTRYHKVKEATNREFWDSTNDKQHSFYVGSYGRNTAVSTSDIDILVELPRNLFDHYNNLRGNVQSRLLQTVRSSILNAYPRSDVRADGQVVKITFSDKMCFEIVPAFKSEFGIYQYPNTNNGGNWLSTNPKAEQNAMSEKNKLSNGLLYDTCRHIRFIRDSYFSSYHLSGIVIDSFAYMAIGNWKWKNSSDPSSYTTTTYEEHLLNYYNTNSIHLGLDIRAPGSNDIVSTSSSYECLRRVLEFMV